MLDLRRSRDATVNFCRSMSSRLRVFDSSVGTKLLIGVTGLFLVLYLIIHIVGNVWSFLGPDVFNAYAHMLGGNPLHPGHRDRAAGWSSWSTSTRPCGCF